MGVKGWTMVMRRGQTMANLMAAILRARGVRVELLNGRVMVPDDQAEAARQIILEDRAERYSHSNSLRRSS